MSQVDLLNAARWLAICTATLALSGTQRIFGETRAECATHVLADSRTHQLHVGQSEVVRSLLPGVKDVVPDDREPYANGSVEGATPATLTPAQAAWLGELEPDRLKGSGGWATYLRSGPIGAANSTAGGAPPTAGRRDMIASPSGPMDMDETDNARKTK